MDINNVCNKLLGDNTLMLREELTNAVLRIFVGNTLHGYVVIVRGEHLYLLRDDYLTLLEKLGTKLDNSSKIPMVSCKLSSTYAYFYTTNLDYCNICSFQLRNKMYSCVIDGIFSIYFDFMYSGAILEALLGVVNKVLLYSSLYDDTETKEVKDLVSVANRNCNCKPDIGVIVPSDKNPFKARILSHFVNVREIQKRSFAVYTKDRLIGVTSFSPNASVRRGDKGAEFFNCDGSEPRAPLRVLPLSKSVESIASSLKRLDVTGVYNVEVERVSEDGYAKKLICCCSGDSKVKFLNILTDKNENVVQRGLMSSSYLSELDYIPALYTKEELSSLESN